MSTPAPAPAPAKKSLGKVVLGGGFGLVTGAVAMYSQAAFDRLVKPAKPLANFQVSAEGLTVTCENRASGQSGFWDYGDGSALEPFDPAAQKATHTYAKPGNYNVKLIVRNFLMDEDSRSVGVETTAPAVNSIAAAAAVADSPKILNLKVETIRDEVPATIRITGQLQNTDEIVWKLGDKTEHLTASGGEIDRYVRIDSEGRFPIVLTALSKSRKDPQVVIQAVDVKRIQNDTYEAMVSVSDTLMRTEPVMTLQRLPAPLRDANGPTKGFTRTISAGPNSVIVKAVADKSMPAAVKNVKIDVAKDQKSALVTGEWALSGDVLAKAAGGSDIPVPIAVTEERRMIFSPGKQTVTGVMDAQQQINVKLPPRPIGSANSTRTISVDFGVSRKDGKRTNIAVGTLDAAGNWLSMPVRITDGPQMFQVKAVTLPNDMLRVTVIAATTPVTMPVSTPIPTGPQPLKK